MEHSDVPSHNVLLTCSVRKSEPMGLLERGGLILNKYIMSKSDLFMNWFNFKEDSKTYFSGHHRTMIRLT